GKKIGPDPRNFNQRVSLGRNDLLIRTFPMLIKHSHSPHRVKISLMLVTMNYRAQVLSPWKHMLLSDW
ncbi:hypothetical protein, partial [Aeromonas caviae]|uniref:hypothetical protein n=1 Tax=Aeromonas caviae TaxID=648 RepID=UPI0030145246